MELRPYIRSNLLIHSCTYYQILYKGTGQKKYEDNNVPDYDLFNKHVFDIFQQVETNEFAYTIVVSKWNVLGYHFLTIAEYLFWRKKWFKDEYLGKTIDDINEDNLFDSNKKRRKNLNADNESFFHNKKKLKLIMKINLLLRK